MNEVDPVPLSSLNHWIYCPRRCGLIHLEREFTDNIHTARGNAEHDKVDGIHHETSGDRRVETALPVWCDRVGLIGKCDVAEFLSDGTPYPIEYKHGPKRKWLNDDIQLEAQAICLEEMLGCPVSKGAIFHARSNRRREVVITPELRRLVEETAAAIRAMLSMKHNQRLFRTGSRENAGIFLRGDALREWGIARSIGRARIEIP